MKIFVVGGAGYIGSICVELLLDEGHDVVVFDNLTRRPSSRGRSAGGVHRRRSCATARKSAVRSQETKPDAVMHFAANALVGESMQNPSKYFRNNVARRRQPARRHGRRPM